MNKKIINEWGATMPKSNPYKEPKRPSKPLTPKKPNNPWVKSEEPEEDIPVGKREKRFDPNNWKNESRNNNCKNESRNMKKLIKLTESDLHRIVKESVKRVLREDWQDGSNYVSTPGYQNNGQGAEKISFDNDARRAYSLRNGQNGYNNHTRISAMRGGGVNGMSHMQFGNGGMEGGQLDSIIGELGEYIGASPEQIKAALGLA